MIRRLSVVLVSALASALPLFAAAIIQIIPPPQLTINATQLISGPGSSLPPMVEWPGSGGNLTLSGIAPNERWSLNASVLLGPSWTSRQRTSLEVRLSPMGTGYEEPPTWIPLNTTETLLIQGQGPLQWPIRLEFRLVGLAVDELRTGLGIIKVNFSLQAASPAWYSLTLPVQVEPISTCRIQTVKNWIELSKISNQGGDIAAPNGGILYGYYDYSTNLTQQTLTVAIPEGSAPGVEISMYAQAPHDSTSMGWVQLERQPQPLVKELLPGAYRDLPIFVKFNAREKIPTLSPTRQLFQFKIGDPGGE